MEGVTVSFVDHIPASIVGQTYHACVSERLQRGYTVLFHIVLHLCTQETDILVPPGRDISFALPQGRRS
jgi:hypothetical protein